MLETNTSKDTKSPTDATILDSFMDLAVLVLHGHWFDFPYRQDVETGNGQAPK